MTLVVGEPAFTGHIRILATIAFNLNFALCGAEPLVRYVDARKEGPESSFVFRRLQVHGRMRRHDHDDVRSLQPRFRPGADGLVPAGILAYADGEMSRVWVDIPNFSLCVAKIDSAFCVRYDI